MIDDHLRQNYIILCQALWMDLEGGEVLVKTQTAHQDLKHPLLYLSGIFPHHL